MKDLIKILAIFAVTLGFAASSYGQVSANATASANIVLSLTPKSSIVLYVNDM